MKKVFILFLFIVIAGCSRVDQVNVIKVDDSELGQVEVNEMDDSWNSILDTQVSFTNEEEINLFTTALRKMSRLPGVVDVSSPDFLIELDDHQYYLWISEDSGSIMDPDDTNTLYRMDIRSAKEIYELFKARITLKGNLSVEEVLASLRKQGLELKKQFYDSDNIFGMKLNGKRARPFELDGQPVFIYDYYSEPERQKGLEDWHEKTAMYNLISYQVFESRNILLFHVYGKDLDSDIHAKFLEGLKWIK